MASGKSSHSDTEQPTTNAGDVTAQIGTAASEASETVQAAAGELTQTLQQRITSQVTAQQERAVDTLETVALLLQRAGEHARKEDKAGIAQYADQAAQQIERFSTAFRDREPDQLLTDTKQLAQQRPGLFLGGALLAGFLGARFLRSSAQAASEQASSGSSETLAGQQPSTGDASGTSGLDLGSYRAETDAMADTTTMETLDDAFLEDEAVTLTDLADENAFGESGGDVLGDMPDTERLR